MKQQSILFLSLALMAGVSFAAMPSFDEIDANNDDVLSKQEINDVLNGVKFSQADRNTDGKISRQEYSHVVQQLSSLEERAVSSMRK